MLVVLSVMLVTYLNVSVCILLRYHEFMTSSLISSVRPRYEKDGHYVMSLKVNF